MLLISYLGPLKVSEFIYERIRIFILKISVSMYQLYTKFEAGDI